MADEGGNQMTLFAPPPPESRPRRGRPPKLTRFLEIPPEINAGLAEITAQVHSGLCQTALPHSCPADPSKPWERRGLGATLTILPGTARRVEGGEREYVGVPYGSRSRLIMIYIQTLGMRSRTVPLGNSMSGWMRSLGLRPTGGQKGNIGEIKEQILRLANCQLIIEITEAQQGGIATTEQRTNIASGLRLWAGAPGREQWPTELELDATFHEHLIENAVTLDREAVAALSGSTLGLDIYASLAHWLPRISSPQAMHWADMVAAFGSEDEPSKEFARRLRKVMPTVLRAYPAASVEIGRNGVLMRPSPKPVPESRLGYTGPVKRLAAPRSATMG